MQDDLVSMDDSDSMVQRTSSQKILIKVLLTADFALSESVFSTAGDMWFVNGFKIARFS